MTATILAGATWSTQYNFVNPIISGLGNGAAYGLLGLGLVLLFKSNRIFNFAQGEFATIGAIATYVFWAGTGVLPRLPFGVACLLGLLAAGLVAILTERAVIRPLFDRPKVVLVVATIGVALFLIGVEGLLPYPNKQALPLISDSLGISPTAFHIGAVAVDWQTIFKLIVLGALAIASFVFFRYTRTGTAILAVSQDATAARVVGISVERISMISWGIAGVVGGAAGILLAVPPAGNVTPGAITGLTIAVAFAAAVLGGMTSLPGAFVGGILLGLVQSFADSDAELIPGLRSTQAPTEIVVLVVLLLVLVFRPRGLMGTEA